MVKADPQGFRDERWPSGVSLGSCRPTAAGMALLGDKKHAAKTEGQRPGSPGWRQAARLCACAVSPERRSGRFARRARNSELKIFFRIGEKDLTRLPDFLWGKSRDQRWHHALKEASKQEGFCHAQVREAAAVAGVDIEFLTIHRAKRDEADYVIVLDGGPGTVAEQASVKALDEALAPIRGHMAQEEEHRIGYVALTRARRKSRGSGCPAAGRPRRSCSRQ